MRFVTFKHQDKESWGIINDQGIVDLGKRFGPSLHEALKQGRLQTIIESASGLGA
ncbi:MAG: DUF2437 domain-containing protein, partial [Desulfobacterales bacterium]|nr:DUF2437 domain-containing protein [Desulfobacterales bacterium]